MSREHGLFKSAASLERSPVSGAVQEFSGQEGDYLLGLSRYVHLNSAEEKEEGEGVQPSGSKRGQSGLAPFSLPVRIDPILRPDGFTQRATLHAV